MGYARLLARYRRPYATQDGFVCVVVYTDNHWRAFFDLIGKKDVFDSDARFNSMGKRTEHIDELYALVAQHLTERTTAEWLSLFERADIPAMPMNTTESLLNDPHLKAVGFFQEAVHPTEGKIRQMRLPSVWSTCYREKQLPAPTIGAHTREVLREAGYSEAAISRWIRDGVINAGIGGGV
jgi:crotonobetainyl-CoA:carnitine CoA-transferase CaiB-like acyl-CoA transferase